MLPALLTSTRAKERSHGSLAEQHSCVRQSKHGKHESGPVAQQRRTSLREAVKGHSANDWQASAAVFLTGGGQQGPGALLGDVLVAATSGRVPAMHSARSACEIALLTVHPEPKVRQQLVPQR